MTKIEELIISEARKQEMSPPNFSPLVSKAKGTISAYGMGFIEGAEWMKEVASVNKTDEEIGERIISLIRNDAYAVSFQTMGQYRTALMEEIRKKIIQSKLTT